MNYMLLFVFDSIIAETPGTSQILLRQRRHSTDELTVTTPPNKWPGMNVLLIDYIFAFITDWFI